MQKPLNLVPFVSDPIYPSEQNHSAYSNQPGKLSVISLAGIEETFQRAGKPGQRFVNNPVVRQWLKLFDQQNGNQRKKGHAEFSLMRRKTFGASPESESAKIP